MFKQRSSIYHTIVLTSVVIMMCQGLQLLILWFCYENDICTMFFLWSVLIVKVSYMMLMYVEKLVTLLYLQ